MERGSGRKAKLLVQAKTDLSVSEGNPIGYWAHNFLALSGVTIRGDDHYMSEEEAR
jgi:hypothetical protein